MKMQRKVVVTMMMAILITLLAVTPALATPPGPGWWTFYQIQNVTGQTGTLTMQAFGKQGTGTTSDRVSQTFSIAPGAALAFHPGLAPTYPGGDRIGFTNPLPPGFEGSAVINAGVAVVAVAQLGNNKSGTVGVDAGTASAFYQGIGAPAAKQVVNFPTVKHNFGGQTTTFYIQATSSAASVTITYKMNDGTTHTQSANIDANRMFAFDPSTATPAIPSSNCGGAATSPCLGAASVTSSSGPIVGVIVEHPHQGSPAPFALSTIGLTSENQDTTIFAPTIKNEFNGGTTGFAVQNVGAQPTTATIKLKVTNSTNPAAPIGTEYTDTESIPAGGAVVFSKFRDNLGGMPVGTFAAASVTSDNGMPLVGTINESKTQANIPGGLAKAVYAAFPQSKSTGKVALPLVKELFQGKTTGVAVVNAGTVATKFNASYIDAAGVTRNFSTVAVVQPGQAVSFFQVFSNPGGQFTGLPDFNVLKNTKNSVSITSDDPNNANMKIVALAQESDRDDLLVDIKNYEAFNQ